MYTFLEFFQIWKITRLIDDRTDRGNWGSKKINDASHGDQPDWSTVEQIEETEEARRSIMRPMAINQTDWRSNR